MRYYASHLQCLGQRQSREHCEVELITEPCKVNNGEASWCLKPLTRERLKEHILGIAQFPQGILNYVLH